MHSRVLIAQPRALFQTNLADYAMGGRYAVNAEGDRFLVNIDDNWIVGNNGELKNAVVYVKDGGKLGGEAKTDPVVLDQTGCIYEPRVVVAMVGQELRARNSDPFNDIRRVQYQSPGSYQP